MVDPQLRSPLSVQKVTAIIRSAGLPLAKSYATAVKGWRNWTEGYLVSKSFGTEGFSVVVHWKFSSHHKLDTPYARAQIQKLSDHLRIVHGLDTLTVFDDITMLYARYKP